MADLDTIFQPQEFRPTDTAPSWVFFPNLRLLFGWGDGLWETLGERMGAVRTLFIIVDPLRPTPLGQVRGFCEWLQDYDASRPPMPFYARLIRDRYGGHLCSRLVSCELCETYAGQPTHPLQGSDEHHPIEANEQYCVGHARTRDGCDSLMIKKRSKKLKPTFIKKMEELGLEHAHGTGKRSLPKPPDEKRVRVLRSAAAHAFAEYLETHKEAYRTTRIQQLMRDHASRPPNFNVEMALQVRIRHQEVSRGKNGMDGAPLRNFTPLQLVMRTASAIADAEATASTFDYTWAPVLRFDRNGLASL